jgi:hypothetical protein
MVAVDRGVELNLVSSAVDREVESNLASSAVDRGVKSNLASSDRGVELNRGNV